MDEPSSSSSSSNRLFAQAPRKKRTFEPRVVDCPPPEATKCNPWLSDHRDIMLSQREIGNQYRNTMQSPYGYRDPRQLYSSLNMADVRKIKYPQEINEELSQQIYGFSPDGRFFIIFEKEEKVIKVYRYGGIGEVMAMKRDSEFIFSKFCHPHCLIEVGSENEPQSIKECVNNYGFTDDSKFLIAGFQLVYPNTEDSIRNQVAQQIALQNRVLDRIQRIRQELEELVEFPGENGPDMTDEQRQIMINRIQFPPDLQADDTFQDIDFQEHEERYRHDMREERIARGLDPDGDEELDPNEGRAEEERQPFQVIDVDDEDTCQEVTIVVVDLEGKNLTCELIVGDVKFDTSRNAFLRDRTITLVHRNGDIVMFELDDRGMLGIKKHLSSKRENYELLTETQWEILTTNPEFLLPHTHREFFEEDHVMNRIQQRVYSKAFELNFPDNIVHFLEFYGSDILRFRITQCVQATEELLLVTYEKRRDKDDQQPSKKPDAFFAIIRWENDEVLDVSNNFGDIFLKNEYREVLQGLFPRTMVEHDLPQLREMIELVAFMSKAEKDTYKTVYDGILCGRGAGNCFSNPFLDEKLFLITSHILPFISGNRMKKQNCGLDDNMNISIKFPLKLVSSRTKRTLFTSNVPENLQNMTFSAGASFHPIEPICIFIFETNMYICRPKIEEEE